MTKTPKQQFDEKVNKLFNDEFYEAHSCIEINDHISIFFHTEWNTMVNEVIEKVASIGIGKNIMNESDFIEGGVLCETIELLKEQLLK